MSEEATITKRQRDILRFALGLSMAKESCRNYFYALPASDPCEECWELVDMGLMEERRPAGSRFYCFHVTEAGRRVAED